MATRGRPTTWTPEHTEAAELYLLRFSDPGIELPEGQVFPSQAGLAVELKVARTTLSSWADNKETRFSAILEKINVLQEMYLLNKGLTGEFNSNITKLALGKHGYHDKVDNNLDVGGDLAALIAEARARAIQE